MGKQTGLIWCLCQRLVNVSAVVGVSLKTDLLLFASAPACVVGVSGCAEGLPLEGRRQGKLPRNRENPQAGPEKRESRERGKDGADTEPRVTRHQCVPASVGSQFFAHHDGLIWMFPCYSKHPRG